MSRPPAPLLPSPPSLPLLPPLSIHYFLSFLTPMTQPHSFLTSLASATLLPLLSAFIHFPCPFSLFPLSPKPYRINLILYLSLTTSFLFSVFTSPRYFCSTYIYPPSLSFSLSLTTSPPSLTFITFPLLLSLKALSSPWHFFFDRSSSYLILLLISLISLPGVSFSPTGTLGDNFREEKPPG